MATEDAQREIEREFAASWDWMERLFTQLASQKNWEGLAAMLRIIAELRERGYDQQLRAGQSLWWLNLSRSRKHGLRNGQHFIRMHVCEGVEMSITYYQSPAPKIEIVQPKIEISPALEDLLKRLLAQPID